MVKAKVRDSNLELYRIIVMLMIVAHHYVVNSGLLDLTYDAPFSCRSVFLLLFGMWGKTGINCFIMITGYFMCSSSITLTKFLKLLLEVVFYNIVIYLTFCVTGYTVFSAKQFLLYSLPVQSVSDGFTSAFILFYLFIPFLNIMVHSMNRNQHLALTALCLFIYTVLGQMPGIQVTMNYVSWFIVLYFISSFVRLYPLKVFESRRLWGELSLVAVLLSMASVLAGIYLSSRTGLRLAYYFVADSHAVFALAVAFTTFLFFKNIKVPYSRMINAIGASTFGVLLIHANSDVMRRWLWNDTFDNVAVYTSSESIILHAFVTVILVFASCILIDRLRIILLERPFFKHLNGAIEGVSSRISAFFD